jgi:amino acid transporter
MKVETLVYCEILGALSYAELGTMNNSAGAEYAYYLDAFGAIPAFLFSWVSTLVLKPSQLAIICLTFAQYFVEAFIDGEAPVFAVKLVCVALICKKCIIYKKNTFVPCLPEKDLPRSITVIT